MKEGDNQRNQGEGLPPLSLSLRFSPSWLPPSLPIPLPRWGVGETRKTTWTLYILSIQGRLTLHVRRLVHISQVSSVFLKSQCQCSCTDTLTKILIPCRCGKCFRQCLAIYFTWTVSVGRRFFVLCAAFMTVRAVITTVRAKKLKSQSKWVMI